MKSAPITPIPITPPTCWKNCVNAETMPRYFCGAAFCVAIDITGIIRPIPIPKMNIRHSTPGIVVSRVIVDSSSIEPNIISDPVTARNL